MHPWPADDLHERSLLAATEGAQEYPSTYICPPTRYSNAQLLIRFLGTLRFVPQCVSSCNTCWPQSLLVWQWAHSSRRIILMECRTQLAGASQETTAGLAQGNGLLSIGLLAGV